MDAQQRDEQTETTRLEAFSDGVFAVAITLLVLNLAVPRDARGGLVPHLREALLEQWPVYLAYVLSFLTVLIMWVNHHALFQIIRRTDQAFMLLNGFLLLVVTALPFGTAVLAAYLQHPERKVAQVLYSGLLLLLTLTSNRMWSYAARDRRLLDPAATQERIQRLTRQYALGPPVQSLAFALAFVSAEASLGLCILLSLFFATPNAVTHSLTSRLPGRLYR